MSVHREPLPLRLACAAIFTYELVALFTNLPTISALNDRHRWIGKGIIAALDIHFEPRQV